MKIWITGGTGFLGQRLTKHFAAKGVEVVSLARRKHPDLRESVQIDLAGDVTELKSFAAENGSPDVVVHAASKQPGSGSLRDFVRANVLTTSNLIDAFNGIAPRQIIFTSTQSVYSPTAKLPVNERHPAVHGSPYAATKRWAEELLQSFTKSQVIILRLPSLYGAGQADSFIDGLGRIALRNQPIELFNRGELIRDALHVTDVVGAINSCIDRPPTDNFCLMNLGCGRAIRTMEYAGALVEALASKSEIVAVDRRASQFDCYADINLAKQMIGFQPTDLRESMRIYADELRA